jgi:hypothetical protein
VSGLSEQCVESTSRHRARRRDADYHCRAAEPYCSPPSTSTIWRDNRYETDWDALYLEAPMEVEVTLTQI